MVSSTYDSAAVMAEQVNYSQIKYVTLQTICTYCHAHGSNNYLVKHGVHLNKFLSSFWQNLIYECL